MFQRIRGVLDRFRTEGLSPTEYPWRDAAAHRSIARFNIWVGTVLLFVGIYGSQPEAGLPISYRAASAGLIGAGVLAWNSGIEMKQDALRWEFDAHLREQTDEGGEG